LLKKLKFWIKCVDIDYTRSKKQTKNTEGVPEMGLAASQMRYLSLTARKTNLEHQEQNLCYQRLELASKSSDIAKAYSEGMSNRTIRISHLESDGQYSKRVWNELTFQNALDQNYRVIGTDGEVLIPSPYTTLYEKDSELSIGQYSQLPDTQKSSCTANNGYTATEKITTSAGKVYEQGSVIPYAEYASLANDQKSKCDSNFKYTIQDDIKDSEGKTIHSAGDVIDYDTYSNMNYENREKCLQTSGTYTINRSITGVNPDYNGWDIQVLLTSGQAQLVGDQFYQYLCQHGYGTGSLTDDSGNPTTYQKLADAYSGTGENTTIAWNTDTTYTFKEDLYTEDDAQVLADYEKATAELEEMDKELELQQKAIETEHKAVETEFEAVQKVVKDNVEKSYKAFNA